MSTSHAPRRIVALCAVLLALPGCASWLLGVDDDAPAAVTPIGSDATLPFGVDGAVPSDSGFVITKPNDGGLCPAASTKCGELCVSPSDPAYGCGAASCTACTAPTSHGQAICAATASCDITCETGYDKQGADCIKQVVVLAGELGLVVDDARQTDTEALELSVTIRNGEGGASVPLDPTRFSVRTSDGLEHNASAAPATLRWWVGGATPTAGASLGPDASYKWRVYVAGITRGGPTPVSITFTTLEATPRKATAAVTLSPCTPCGAVCTYLDMDTANCGTCGVNVTSAGTCTAGTPTCPGALALCGASCKDLQTDIANCRTCGNACTIPANASAATCSAATCDFDCNSGYEKVGAACLRELQWRSVASPTTNPLLGVWGSGTADVWAVGGNGTILRYNGTAWSSVNSGGTEHLRGVWGSGTADVWAVGNNGTILRYSGTAWSSVNSGGTNEYYGVWGSGPTDVWAVNNSRTILHYNGTAWSSVNSGGTDSLYSVWGSGPTDVWAVGNSLTIRRYNGTAWSSVNAGTTQAVDGVWGSGPADVWAVGGRGTLIHYNGTTWSSVNSGTSNWLSSVWGSGPANVWAVGEGGTILRYNGTTWSRVAAGTTTGLSSVWGSGPADVWAVGNDGSIFHYSR